VIVPCLVKGYAWDEIGRLRISDETGRVQQVCKSHMGRNTDVSVDVLAQSKN
jgi:hypothetical protein